MTKIGRRFGARQSIRASLLCSTSFAPMAQQPNRAAGCSTPSYLLTCAACRLKERKGSAHVELGALLFSRVHHHSLKLEREKERKSPPSSLDVLVGWTFVQSIGRSVGGCVHLLPLRSVDMNGSHRRRKQTPFWQVWRQSRVMNISSKRCRQRHLFGALSLSLALSKVNLLDYS